MKKEYEVYKYLLEHKLIEEIKKLEAERDALSLLSSLENDIDNQVRILNEEIYLKNEELEKVRDYNFSVNIMDLMNGNFFDKETMDMVLDKIEKESIEKQKNTFEEIRQLYMDMPGYNFRKFKKFISLKAPKWKEIAKYSQKELDFILDTYYGRTPLSKKNREDIENIYYMDQDLKNKKISDSNWLSFMILLNDYDFLKKRLNVNLRSGLYGRR